MGETGAGGAASEFEELVHDFGEEHAAVLAAQAANPSSHPDVPDGGDVSDNGGVSEASDDDDDGPSNARGIHPPLLDRGQGEQE